MTTGADENLDHAEMIFKSLLWDPLVQSVILYVLASLHLTFWPVRPAVSALFKTLGDELYDHLKLAIDVGAIVFVNREHETAYQKASVTLKIIAHDKGVDSDEFKKAREEAKIALSKFVRFNGV